MNTIYNGVEVSGIWCTCGAQMAFDGDSKFSATCIRCEESVIFPLPSKPERLSERVARREKQKFFEFEEIDF